jgi:hypothetical protein
MVHIRTSSPSRGSAQTKTSPRARNAPAWAQYHPDPRWRRRLDRTAHCQCKAEGAGTLSGEAGTLTTDFFPAYSALIRIGTERDHMRTFIAGISGATLRQGTPVEVNSNGQLGIVLSLLSSCRVKDGQPLSVRDHVLPAILLNELQRQQREIDELRAQVRALIDGGKASARH